METRHIENRKRLYVPPYFTLSTRCGLTDKRSLKRAWNFLDAQDFFKAIARGLVPKHFGKTWTFCHDCEAHVK